LCFTGSPALRAQDSPDLAFPTEYKAFQAALESVLKAERVPDSEKNDLKEWSQRIDAGFQAEWQKVLSVHEASSARMSELERETTVHNRAVRMLNIEFDHIDRNDKEAIRDFNNRADEVNAQKEKIDAEKAKIREEWDKNVAVMQDWINKSEMIAFTDRAQAVLAASYDRRSLGIIGGSK